MNKLLFSLLLLVPLSTLADSDSTNWKFYGGSKGFNKEYIILFYSENTIEKTSNGNVRFWIKGLRRGEIEKTYKKPEDKIAESVAKRLLAGYNPPISKIENLNHDKMLEVSLWEAIADKGEIEPESRIFYELDCAGKKMRELSISMTDSKGRFGSSNSEHPFKYIAPETNAERLLKLVCDSPSN